MPGTFRVIPSSIFYERGQSEEPQPAIVVRLSAKRHPIVLLPAGK